MQINLNDNPALKDALLNRLKAEYAETAAANFCLDMLAGQLQIDKTALEQRVEDLVAANTRMVDDNNALRAELEHAVRPDRAPRKVAG
jgi:hypothetical protein